MSDYQKTRGKARELFKILDGEIEAFFGDDYGEETLWLNPKVKNASSLHNLEGVECQPYKSQERKSK